MPAATRIASSLSCKPQLAMSNVHSQSSLCRGAKNLTLSDGSTSVDLMSAWSARRPRLSQRIADAVTLVSRPYLYFNTATVEGK